MPPSIDDDLKHIFETHLCDTHGHPVTLRAGTTVCISARNDLFFRKDGRALDVHLIVPGTSGRTDKVPWTVMPGPDREISALMVHLAELTGLKPVRIPTNSLHAIYELTADGIRTLP